MVVVRNLPSSEGVPAPQRRWLILATIVLSVLAGPAFFAFALLTALYAPIPSKNIQSTEAALKRTAARPSNTASQPDDKKLTSVRPSGTGADDAADQNNPLKTFLALRGSSENLGSALAKVAHKSTAGAGQKYRTVCVRMCDGYFFPIGTNVTSDKFAENEEQCRSRCGSPARLFVYPEKGGSPLAMRDLAGNPYLTTKNAFRFHTKYVAQCRCRAQPWTIAAKERHIRYAAKAAESRMPIAKAMPVTETNIAAVEVRARDAGGRNKILRDIRPRSLADLPTTKRVAALEFQPADTSVELATLLDERMAAITKRSDLLASFDIKQSLAEAALREDNRRRLLAERARRNFIQVEGTEPADYFAVVAFAGTPPQVNDLPTATGSVASAYTQQAYADVSADEILRRNLVPLR